MRFSIRWKLMFTYVLVTLLVLAVTALILNQTLKTHYLSRMSDHLSRDADLAVTYVLGSAPDLRLGYEVDSLADEMGELLRVRVTLIDPSGIVRGDSELDGDDLLYLENYSNRPEVLRAYDEGTGVSIRRGYTLDRDMMYLARPIFRQGSPTGLIRLAVPLSEIDQALQGLRRSMSLAFLIGLFLAVLVSYAAARRVTRPINTISRIAEMMAQGDFSVKTTTRSSDEIGRLARTINKMSSQLDLMIRHITTERDRLRGVLGGMREGVMLTDSEGRIVMTNEAFRNIFGVTMPLEGATPIEATRDARLHQAVEKACESRKEVIDEIELYLPAQRVLYVHVVPLGPQEKLTGAVAVLYDVTQLKNLERARKDFVANVSHELNTPLAAIRGYAETLQGKALENQETARQFLQIITRHAERMTKLVSDLLALSKWESEAYKPTFATVHLRPLINRALETFHDIIRKKGLNLHTDIADLYSIMADEKSLEQVILNLLDNAVKFTPEGGRIAISATEEGALIQIAVSDTGVGIPSADLPRIFERFYRVDKDRSRELGGTGLGLSIVKHIVQAHGGQVWAESQVGQGSTFSFTIPKA